ncbi:MAG: hypothetical protein KKD77_23135, partial [Gammaproteobacteria bacterium]|nr:hypothetical protein [Gammaproteobacteria bacterium]
MTILEGHQIANAEAESFVVAHRYFAGPDFDTLTLSNFTENGTPTGWTVAHNTVTTSGSEWVDITQRVYGKGSWTQEWQGSTVKWTANLSGQNYGAKVYVNAATGMVLGYGILGSGKLGYGLVAADRNYLGEGKSLLCMEYLEVKDSWLTSDTASGTTNIPINNGIFWPSSGSGEINGERFAYTGISGNGLTSASHVGAGGVGSTGTACTHYAGDPVSRIYGWRMAWVGMIEATPWQDNYRHGAWWNLTVRSAEASLERVDSPRLRIGAINVTEQGSVTTTPTLSVPALEAGNNEFVGTTQNVDASNIIDGRPDTVWISQDAPSITSEDGYSVASNLVIDEVFFKPVTGFSPKNTWWVELYHNGGAGVDVDYLWLFTTNRDGVDVALRIPHDTLKLSASGRVVICANRQSFEAYTGGVPSGTTVVSTSGCNSWQYDPSGSQAWFQNMNITGGNLWILNNFVNTTPAAFNLSSSQGWVGFTTSNRVGGSSLPTTFTTHMVWPWGAIDVVKWADSGSVTGIAELSDQWSGCAVNTSSLVAGQSIRRNPTGNDATGGSADWAVETFPRPGGKWSASSAEWAKIELAEHTTALTATASAAATTLTVDSTEGWPTPITGACYQGILDTEVFDYTAVTGTTITLSGSITDEHADTTPVYPYTDEEKQSGWPIKSITISRRSGLSTIEQGDIYLSSASGCDDYDQVDFATGYYSDSPQRFGSTAAYAYEGFALNETTPGFRWIRTIMIVIHKMSDGGRAKINEVKATLVQGSIGESGTNDITEMTPGGVLKKVLVDYSWLADGDVVDNTSYTLPDGIAKQTYGIVGSISMAVTSMPRALDDVAKSHGVLVRYGLDGKVYIDRDPWWVAGTEGDDGVIYGFNAARVRGDLQYAEERVLSTGLALTARLPDGAVLSRKFAGGGANTGTGIVEVSDLVVRTEAMAQWMADVLWFKETHPHRVTLIVRGVGEWCRVGQRFWIMWDLANQGFEVD